MELDVGIVRTSNVMPLEDVDRDDGIEVLREIPLVGESKVGDFGFIAFVSGLIRTWLLISGNVSGPPLTESVFCVKCSREDSDCLATC